MAQLLEEADGLVWSIRSKLARAAFEEAVSEGVELMLLAALITQASNMLEADFRAPVPSK